MNQFSSFFRLKDMIWHTTIVYNSATCLDMDSCKVAAKKVRRLWASDRRTNNLCPIRRTLSLLLLSDNVITILSAHGDAARTNSTFRSEHLHLSWCMEEFLYIYLCISCTVDMNMQIMSWCHLFTKMTKIPYLSYEKVKLALYPLWINAE